MTEQDLKARNEFLEGEVKRLTMLLEDTYRDVSDLHECLDWICGALPRRGSLQAWLVPSRVYRAQKQAFQVMNRQLSNHPAFH